VIKHFVTLTPIQRMWVLGLIIGIAIVWFGYLVNFIFGLVPYITAPVLFSILVYFLSFLGLKQSSLFTSDARYHNSAHKAVQVEECYAQLIPHLTTTKPFKNASITLPKLAKELGVSANLLSETINKKSGYNFSDFINSYRIKEAQQLLERPEAMYQKIAAIAYETGFNSLSVFNAAFKKFTGQTPSEYRKKR